jgi:ketosteroid isomerase-like protein
MSRIRGLDAGVRLRHVVASPMEVGMRIANSVALAVCLLSVPLPAIAQAANGLSPADMRTINETTQAFAKATLAKDWATVASGYLDDAVVNPPNEPAVKGRAAIRAWFEKFPPLTDLKFNAVTVDGRGDLAYVVGTYTMTLMPPGAPGPIKDSGKYVEIRRRQPDGRWLLAVDMFSSDLSAAPPPK